MKKWIAMIFVLLFTLSLVGCAEDVVLKETYVYQVSSDIHSLEIQIGAADFAIKHADTFSVESNLKYLSISEDDGVLKIIEETKKGSKYTDPILTLYMPTDMMFESIDISTGAAKLTADALSAESLKLQLGAGDVSVSSLSVGSRADIVGGVGELTIADGIIRNLELEMGVGELNLTAALYGSCDLTFGVGKSNLTLLGNRKDYEVNIEKGLGSVTVDGKAITDYENRGSGQNRVEIKGGIGAINLTFQASENWT